MVWLLRRVSVASCVPDPHPAGRAGRPARGCPEACLGMKGAAIRGPAAWQRSRHAGWEGWAEGGAEPGGSASVTRSAYSDLVPEGPRVCPCGQRARPPAARPGSRSSRASADQPPAAPRSPATGFPPCPARWGVSDGNGPARWPLPGECGMSSAWTRPRPHCWRTRRGGTATLDETGRAVERWGDRRRDCAWARAALGLDGPIGLHKGPGARGGSAGGGAGR